MRHLRLLIVPLLALGLVGCQAGSNVGNFVAQVAATATSPLSKVDIYRVKNVYAAANQLAVDYRQYCYARSYAALMNDQIAQPVCKYRRKIIRTFQSKRVIASRAIANASTNSLLSAAWQAVNDYKNSVPVVK